MREIYYEGEKTIKAQELLRQKLTIDITFKFFKRKIDREKRSRKKVLQVRRVIEESFSI